MRIDSSTPILLVSRHTAATSLFAILLQKLGFERVESAADSISALSILKSIGPGVVIADLHLEPGSGLDLLGNIRSDERLKRSPFILFSPTLTCAEALGMKSGGVDSFLLVPFRQDVLAPKLEAAIRRRPQTRAVADLRVKRSTTLGRRIHHWQ